MRKTFLYIVFSLISITSFCWGFYAHERINYYAVFLLPPEMMIFYKPNIQFITEHAVDPDKRRYAVASEAPKHYIDIDFYGSYPYSELPRKYDEAIAKYTENTIVANGTVPWWILIMLRRLTDAFKEKDKFKILKLSAEIGHYIADSHVPLHVSSNHDGQLTGQKGIHGFWESRVPELLAEKEFDFMVGKAQYIASPAEYIWKRILESGAASDTVLRYEAELSKAFPEDKKYSFEERRGKLVKQYSSAFTIAYNTKLSGMIERRMIQSIASVAGFWYTAWVNAGQPDLKELQSKAFSNEDLQELEVLDSVWKYGTPKGRIHE